jgi:hypothetical protein
VTAAPPRPRPTFRVAAALAGARLRLSVVPGSAIRRQQRVQVCSAARILTALGVRVRVFQPGTPWPRHRPLQLVTAADPGWIGDLALLTAVPRTTSGWSVVAHRVLPAATATPAPGAPTDAALCPVAVRFRDGDRLLDGVPRCLAEVVAVRDLVVEVELLPAREPRRTAAA